MSYSEFKCSFGLRVVTLAVALLSSACGQTGPLIHPDDVEATQTQQPAATVAAPVTSEPNEDETEPASKSGQATPAPG